MDKLDVEAQKPVVAWLTLVGLMVFCMIIVGGATRLTHSGLSIVEWETLVGTIPPIDHEDWDEVFDEYKTSPEYQQERSMAHWQKDFLAFSYWVDSKGAWVGIWLQAASLMTQESVNIDSLRT